MRRIFACSRFVSPKSSLTVPRRELAGILLGIKKVVELAELLEIAKDKVFLHTDSTICMFWLEKYPGDLSVFVSNRVQEIQNLTESRGIKIFHTYSLDNPGDNCSKAKSAKHYINNELWEHGPRYMRHENWEIGRSIREIREKKFPSSSKTRN